MAAAVALGGRAQGANGPRARQESLNRINVGSGVAQLEFQPRLPQKLPVTLVTRPAASLVLDSFMLSCTTYLSTRLQRVPHLARDRSTGASRPRISFVSRP